MKNIKQNNFKILFLLGIILVQSCETTNLDVVDSPNAVSPSTADIDLFLNGIQIDLANFHSGYEGSNFDGMSEFGMEPVRMIHGFGPSYRELNDPDDFNQLWETAYSKILSDIRAMSLIASENGYTTHLAIGKIIEAYVMMTLVDFFGPVPYSEAIEGSNSVFNPSINSGEDIYFAVDELLKEAIVNLNEDEFSLPTNDLYYNGSEENWIKLANTLRLKLMIQSRLVNPQAISEINQLISGNNLILDNSADFQFQYSTSLSAPDSRHPFFEKNYGGSGPNSDFYIGNYYMDLLANTYSSADPRTRYYFYRQVANFDDATVVTKDCVTQDRPGWYSENDVYCTVRSSNGFDGFWGRDHLDPDGIPPDQQYRTLFGVYPAGGAFDDNSFRNLSGSTAPSEGLAGAGIAPIMLASYTNFMLAEASLTLGTSGDALNYLEQGIRLSITKTLNFGASLANTSSFIPTNESVEAYIDEVKSLFNDSNNDEKLNIVIQQYFIALWGNGIEAYNTFRRTGKPNNIQPAVELNDPGVFVHSNWYPGAAANNNQNVTQKDNVETPVFWDNNPTNHIN